MFNEHGGHSMGILPVLRDLGPRYPAPVSFLSIPDTDNIPFVSPFCFSQPSFLRLTSAQHGQTDPNVSSFRLILVRRVPHSPTAA